MSITREFDLIINAGTSSPLVINANQNDSGETWLFNLYQDDGTKVTPLAGQIVGLKTDGHAIVNAGTVNGSGQVVITETAQITACPGSNIFELVFDSVHGTANFILLVEKSPVDDDADFSESDISAINQAITMAIDSATVQAVQNGLSAETAARTSADNLLQTEIDQIIAPSGEAPSAAEVTNARIGADGTVYDTLGNAIRGQVTDLNQALNVMANDLSDISSLIVPVVLELGSINTNTGAYANSTDGTRARTTQLIPCKSDTKYNVKVVNNTGNALTMRILYYDAGKGYIDTTAGINIAAGATLEEIRTSRSLANYLALRFDGTGLTPTNILFSAFTYDSQKYNTVINYGNIETSGLDLNTGDFIRPGMWTLADLTKKPSNWPSSVTGRLVIFTSSSDSSFGTVQIVMDSDNFLYFRYSKANASWGDWNKAATKADIDKTIYNKNNVEAIGLDLNTGDFIHPGMWAVNNTSYLPKNCPTAKRCRIISYASTTDNTIYTFQVVIDADGIYYSRFSTTTNVWTSWIKWNTYNVQAFETLYTNPQPFVNNYDINRLSASEPNKVSKLYALIDAVTEQDVTITKDTLGVDESGNFNIYNYKVSLNTGEKPVVLIICGEHGDELSSAYIGYYLYKEIVNGVLKKYLSYVDFWYVPLMNPYGYENHTRNNANNVNLNRDFPCMWEYSQTGHNTTGNYSLSQKETQYIYNLLVNNKDKILFICNKHDTGGIAKKIATNQEDIVAYVSTVLQTDKIVNNGIAKWHNKQVRETDSWIIDDCSVDISDYNLVASCAYVTPGSLDLFANSIGIHGSLLEIAGSSYYTADGYDYYPTDEYHYKDLERLGLDFFVNYISTTIEKNPKVLENDNLIPSILRYYTRKESSGTWVSVEQYWNGSTLVDI